MRKTTLVFCLFFSSVLSFGQIPVNSIIKPGVKTMKNANGDPSNIRLESKENGVIVVFSCNTCPFVVGSSYSSNYALGILEQIKDKKMANFFKPAMQISRVKKVILYGVTRSSNMGVFKPVDRSDHFILDIKRQAG